MLRTHAQSAVNDQTCSQLKVPNAFMLLNNHTSKFRSLIHLCAYHQEKEQFMLLITLYAIPWPSPVSIGITLKTQPSLWFSKPTTRRYQHFKIFDIITTQYVCCQRCWCLFGLVHSWKVKCKKPNRSCPAAFELCDDLHVSTHVIDMYVYHSSEIVWFTKIVLDMRKCSRCIPHFCMAFEALLSIIWSLENCILRWYVIYSQLWIWSMHDLHDQPPNTLSVSSWAVPLQQECASEIR